MMQVVPPHSDEHFLPAASHPGKVNHRLNWDEFPPSPCRGRAANHALSWGEVPQKYLKLSQQKKFTLPQKFQVLPFLFCPFLSHHFGLQGEKPWVGYFLPLSWEHFQNFPLQLNHITFTSSAGGCSPTSVFMLERSEESKEQIPALKTERVACKEHFYTSSPGLQPNHTVSATGGQSCAMETCGIEHWVPWLTALGTEPVFVAHRTPQEKTCPSSPAVDLWCRDSSFFHFFFFFFFLKTTWWSVAG